MNCRSRTVALSQSGACVSPSPPLGGGLSRRSSLAAKANPELSQTDAWGPFAHGLDPAERNARLRALRALVAVLCGPWGRTLADALAAAESAPERMGDAVAALDNLTALDRRHVLASYARLSAPRNPIKADKKRTGSAGPS